MKKNSAPSIKKLIFVLNILRKEGIDLSGIKQTNTVKGKTIPTKLSDVVSLDILEKHGLDGEYKIGAYITLAKTACNGNSRLTITEEDKEKIERFRLFDRNSDREKAIKILERLQKAGIDTSSIPAMIRDKKGEKSFAIASEVVENDILEKCKIDPEYKLGSKIHYLRQAYKGVYPITEEERVRIEKLKILEEGRTSISDLIPILKDLQSEGVDITKIQSITRKNGKRRYVVLSDIITEEILKKYNWDGDYRIGPKILTAKLAYKGIRNISNN